MTVISWIQKSDNSVVLQKPAQRYADLTKVKW